MKTKFWGKSLEIQPLGNKKVYLKKHEDNFIFDNPKSCVYNIIFGKIYVDFYGVTSLNLGNEFCK